jgi:hypothetical protein
MERPPPTNVVPDMTSFAKNHQDLCFMLDYAKANGDPSNNCADFIVKLSKHGFQPSVLEVMEAWGAVLKRGQRPGVGLKYTSLRQLLHPSRGTKAWSKLAKQYGRAYHAWPVALFP